VITIELPQEEWLKVLDIIADRPFRQVAPLINNIQRQMMPQMKMPPANGELHAVTPEAEG
jgi:hypothetical protein